MKRSLRTLLLAATALIAAPALAQEEQDAAEAQTEAAATAKTETSKDYTVIKMGNDEIKNSEVIDTWKGLFPGGSAPDFNSFDENIRQNVLRGLASERLIYNEAIKAGYDKDPEVKKRIASVEKQVIMQGFMENKAKNLVTDEQLRAAYAEKAAAMKGQEEVKARHILVTSEDEAKKLHEQIKKGGDFEKLAKEKSTDKGSGANGGELGWFTKERMVPEFAEASFKLKKGEISAPIKSEFGWHIIQVEDRRPLQLASFEDMKESLKGELANKAVQSYVEGLLKKADIKYYTADGKEKPFSTSLSPAAKGTEKPAEKVEEKAEKTPAKTENKAAPKTEKTN
jgi:peptidyl-prolyl cis-trans isomerase C